MLVFGYNNLSTIGCYLGYDFNNPVYVCRVEGKIRMLSYKIQYSDDNIAWSDAVTNSSAGYDYGNDFSENLNTNLGAHRYWRLYVNGGQKYNKWGALIYDLQFYGYAQ